MGRMIPDRAKVMKALEHCATDIPCSGQKFRDCVYRQTYGDECFRKITSDALELLKEQEPVKPVCDIDTWTCGKCGCKLEHQEMHGEILFHDIYDFCPHCGKAVKWDA